MNAIALWELLLVAVGLAMDAFAVSLCKGLTQGKQGIRRAVVIALYFGVFQAIMPTLGYLLGSQFARFIQDWDHWIAFILLAFIGGKMIYESFKPDGEIDEEKRQSVAMKVMLPLAVATSIDALAVGVSFAFLDVAIFPAALTIGVVTFALSFAGVKLGNVLGAKFESRAELAGGIILILIGLKILLEHLGVLGP